MPLDMKAIKEVVEGALGPVSEVIDSLHTSREEKDAAKIKLAIAQGQLEVDFKQIQASVIIAEATGKSPLQRNWRPGLMVLFGYIIAHNYVVAPIGTWVSAMFGGPTLPVLELPTGLWATLDLGIGGYMGLRTYEKVTLGKESKPKMPRKVRKALVRLLKEKDDDEIKALLEELLKDSQGDDE